MKKYEMALLAAMMAAGLALAAGDAEKPPQPAGSARDAARPAPALPLRLPAPPLPGRPLEAGRLAEMLLGTKDVVARWEQMLGNARTDETRKYLAEAVEKGKDLQSAIEQAAAALQAGKGEEANHMVPQLRQKQQKLMYYMIIAGTCEQIDRTKHMQDERGKDNPELNAQFQRIIDLLDKRLDLQKQIGAVEDDLVNARQELSQSLAKARAAQPPKKPEPKPAPAN